MNLDIHTNTTLHYIQKVDRTVSRLETSPLLRFAAVALKSILKASPKP